MLTHRRDVRGIFPKSYIHVKGLPSQGGSVAVRPRPAPAPPSYPQGKV